MKGQLRKYGTNNYYATKQEDLTDLGLFQFEASVRKCRSTGTEIRNTEKLKIVPAHDL